ncbi:hypothetical protein [Aureivirga sp. CE67]|uniref:hypothetical protein n=1 Tax=Aureivirga sp. CE67 TaxID=1788983 RepID=UPI0018CA3AEB|nr:hypothetical protein [Aureivirga sp. CE67]
MKTLANPYNYQIFINKTKIKTPNGILEFKNDTIDLSLEFSVVKKYHDFEDEDDLLIITVKVIDKFDKCWAKKIVIDSYQLWDISPVNKMYFSKMFEGNILIEDLKGNSDTRIINHIVLDRNNIEIVFEKYLEYSIDLVNYDSENEAEIPETLGVNIRFKSKYQDYERQLSYSILTEELFREAIFSNLSSDWEVVEN